MFGCLYCQIYGRPTSRITGDAQAKCFKNRKGTCSACDKLTEIDRKIDKARRALEGLFHEREDLASVLNEHHDPIVHKLPPEIGSRILVFLKPETPPEDQLYSCYNEKETIKSLFTPGQVCKDWRLLAQGTPNLWNVVCATIRQCNCIPSIVMVQDWLKRSGELPLSLQVSIPGSPSKLVLQSARKIMAEAMLHAQRWVLLDLKAPSDVLSWMSEFLLKSNLDRLHHIKATFYNDSDQLQLSATPRRLTHYSGSLSQISVNYEQLTHVTLDLLYVEDAMRLFRDAPHLLSCACDQLIPGGKEDDTLSASPVLAPSLCTFKVAMASVGVWEHFQFPSLESLSILWPDISEDEDEFWEDVQALLRRSSCAIRELEIKDSSSPENAILEVLKLTPDLERLSLEGRIVSDSLFSLLDASTIAAARKPIPDFMGKLQSLSCKIHGPTFDWSSLIGFLSTTSKWPLRSFDFRYQGSSPKDLKDTLKPLLDAVYGLKVKILDSQGQDLVEKWQDI